MVPRRFSTSNISTRPSPVFGVHCLAQSADLERGHNIRSGAKCLVCDTNLLRLHVFGRIFDTVEFEFQGLSLLRSAFLGQSAISRQFFSEEIFEVFQLVPEWNPVDDDATFTIFGGFLDSFGDEVIRQRDGVSLGCILFMQPKKDPSSIKKPSRLGKLAWNLSSFFEERLQVGYSSKSMRQGVDYVVNGVLSVQYLDIRALGAGTCCMASGGTSTVPGADSNAVLMK